MKKLVLATVAAMMLLGATNVRADGDFRPSRVRLLIHDEFQVNNEARLRVNFIPAGNLLAGIAPLAYLGLGWQALPWLDVEGTLGWCFKTDEPIFSTRLSLNFSELNVYAWGDLELQIPSEGGYWFLMAEYKLLDWLHLGAEGEGWGNFVDGSPWSNGGGPNLLFRLGHVGLDLALHIRDQNEATKPEFFLRLHLFL